MTWHIESFVGELISLQQQSVASPELCLARTGCFKARRCILYRKSRFYVDSACGSSHNWCICSVRRNIYALEYSCYHRTCSVCSLKTKVRHVRVVWPPFWMWSFSCGRWLIFVQDIDNNLYLFMMRNNCKNE